MVDIKDAATTQSLMDTDACTEGLAVDQGAGGQDPLRDMPASFAPMAPDADLDNQSQGERDEII